MYKTFIGPGAEKTLACDKVDLKVMDFKIESGLKCSLRESWSFKTEPYGREQRPDLLCNP